jgi:hypothetical protein
MPDSAPRAHEIRVIKRGAARPLKSSGLSKNQALPAREGDLGAVLQDEDIAHQVHDARVLDVLEIDNAVAPGAKELRPVESFLAVAKRAANKHG